MSTNVTYAALRRLDSGESYCPEEFDRELEESRASILASLVAETIEVDTYVKNSSSYQDGAMFTCIKLYESGTKFPGPSNISTKAWTVESDSDGSILLNMPNYSEIEDYLKTRPAPLGTIGLSCFGSLAIIWKCQIESLNVEIARILEEQNYHFIACEVLDQPYTGKNEDSIGKTWTHRYFCDVAWA